MNDHCIFYNVIDTRTNQFHSVVIVKERNARFFVPEIDNSEEEIHPGIEEE